jgi:pimeloyl-ACP methyl ester carboxylesterase
MAYLASFVWQAAEEFPAALSALRQQLPVDNGPLGVLGGSLGGMVVLQILARSQIPIAAAALVNPAVRGAVGPRARWGRHRAALPVERGVPQGSRPAGFRGPRRGHRGARTTTSAVGNQRRTGLPSVTCRRSGASRCPSRAIRTARPHPAHDSAGPGPPAGRTTWPAARSTAPHSQGGERSDQAVVPAPPHDSLSHQAHVPIVLYKFVLSHAATRAHCGGHDDHAGGVDLLTLSTMTLPCGWRWLGTVRR